MILPLDTHVPKIGKNVFIAPDAWVIGDVELGDNVSVFFGAVLRGDLMPIRVGQGSNIQEHAVIHTTHGTTPALIGEYVTIGHRAIVHGAEIGNRSLVGMGAIVLDRTVVGENCLIGAGSVIPERKSIPSRSMVIGAPGKVVRTLNETEIQTLTAGAERYIHFGAIYRDLLFPNTPSAQ